MKEHEHFLWKLPVSSIESKPLWKTRNRHQQKLLKAKCKYSTNAICSNFISFIIKSRETVALKKVSASVRENVHLGNEMGNFFTQTFSFSFVALNCEWRWCCGNVSLWKWLPTCTISPCSCPEAVKVKWHKNGMRFHCGVGTWIK